MPQILTNKYNLPKTIVDACKNDGHRVAGDISVTQLIDGPQVRLLKMKHNYEVDVAETLWALMGTALHNILERANISSVRKRAFILTAETIMKAAENTTVINEDDEKKVKQLKAAANYIFGLIPHLFPEIGERYLFEVTLRHDFGDWTLYGTFDLYDKETGILYDYKFCSVYQWIFPEAQKKWKAQTNVYALMLDQQGYKINGIRIIAFFRDWSDNQLNRNKDYPKMQIQEIDVELGNPKDPQQRPWQVQVQGYIEFRLNLHRRAENGETIRCTGEDRWAKSDEWKIKTPGSKKALARFDDQQLAVNFVQENKYKYDLQGKRLDIEYHPGDSMRCAKYCPVASVCQQRQEELILKAKLEKDNEY